jgi:hypothetical protein
MVELFERVSRVETSSQLPGILARKVPANRNCSALRKPQAVKGYGASATRSASCCILDALGSAMSRLFLLTSIATLACMTAVACSAENPVASSTNAGGSSAMSSSASNTGAGGFTSSSAGGSTGSGGDCAGTLSKAQPLPLDIFVMLDQSGSMSQGAGNGLSRWEAVKAAISAFVTDPASAGIGMGIQFFGLPQPLVPGCSAIACTVDTDCTGGCTLCMPQGICQGPFNPDIDSCDAIDYAWADVPIQPLPGVANTIIASIASHSPGTNTPTSPALQGAIDYARTWQQAHPDHITVVAFATDGDPAVCDTDLDHINAIAAAGYSGVPSIKTFVIGVGPSLQALDGIAAAGGTTAAFHVDLNTMATEQLVAAMNTIRGAALQCTYVIPPPPPGMTANFDLVNVEYTPGDGSMTRIFPKVLDKAHCPLSGDGWYYDNNAAPTQIILCDATCQTVSTDIMAEIYISLGCETIAH